MSSDENISQNPIPAENPIPPSPQEPNEPTLENTAYSEPFVVPLEAPKAPTDDFSVKSNDIPLPDSTLIEPENELKTEEKQAENESILEPILEPIQTTEPETAQISVNEPLVSRPEPLKTEPQTFSQPKISLARELLVKARNMIQFRKRKKLDRVMTLFLKKSKITNDEVREFLHVSDATATRYLSILENEGRIKQNGKTGHAVSYTRI